MFPPKLGSRRATFLVDVLIASGHGCEPARSAGIPMHKWPVGDDVALGSFYRPIWRLAVVRGGI